MVIIAVVIGIGFINLDIVADMHVGIVSKNGEIEVSKVIQQKSECKSRKCAIVLVLVVSLLNTG